MRNLQTRSLLLLPFAVLTLPALAYGDSSYLVRIDAPPSKRAEKGVAHIHITPGAGFHVNKEYPAAVNLTEVPPGVRVDKPKQTAKDAVKLAEETLDFDVAYTAADAGKKIFGGELKFAVCSASSCDPKKEKLSFSVEVK